MVEGHEIVLAPLFVDALTDGMFERFQFLLQDGVAVVELRQTVFGDILVRRVVAEVKQRMRGVETILRQGTIDNLHLGDTLSLCLPHRLALVFRQTVDELLPDVLRRYPAVACAYQSDEEGTGGIDVLGTDAQHLAGGLGLVHLLGVDTHAQVNGLYLHALTAETVVQGGDHFTFDDITLEVHIAERRTDENIEALPAHSGIHRRGVFLE